MNGTRLSTHARTVLQWQGLPSGFTNEQARAHLLARAKGDETKVYEELRRSRGVGPVTVRELCHKLGFPYPAQMRSLTAYRCEHAPCLAAFEHPPGECDRGIDSSCAHLIEAGWRPVWVSVRTKPNTPLLFARGGWLCPVHAKSERCTHIMAGTTGERCWLAAGHDGTDHQRSPRPHQEWNEP